VDLSETCRVLCQINLRNSASLLGFHYKKEWKGSWRNVRISNIDSHQNEEVTSPVPLLTSTSQPVKTTDISLGTPTEVSFSRKFFWTLLCLDTGHELYICSVIKLEVNCTCVGNNLTRIVRHNIKLAA
jgi:hypothetical protein